MVNMAPAAGVSRSLLNSPTHHLMCSGVYNLSRGVGRTFTAIPSVYQRGIKSHPHHSHQFRAAGRGFVPSFKEQSGTVRIAGNNKRTLASQAGSGEANESCGLTKGEEDLVIRLEDPYTIQFGNPEDEGYYLLDRHWLRDACNCSICVDPDSGQKNFGTCDVPSELPIQKISRTEDGGVEIVWDDDFLNSGKHVSRYPPAAIERQLLSGRSFHLPHQTLWDKAIIEQDRLTIDYNEWIAGGSGFLSGLHHLRTHGLLFLHNVPSSEESVLSIANQIGNLQETFYGRTWDVRSKPKAENVAYTSSYLGLHQDLLYVTDTPRIQILHCLENTCEGGESMFSDGMRAAHLIELGPKRYLDFLSKRLVRYEYKKNGHHYQSLRPVVNQTLRSVFWSPPFQATRQRPIYNEEGSRFYRGWLAAANKFRELVEDERWMYQYKMQPGECVLFDNIRVLHGRRKFDASTGSRWLKGAYIANDVFTSKLATLSQQLMEIGNGHKLKPQEQAKRFAQKYVVWDQTRKMSWL
ncbi:Clavaminate synthase-like protein [Hypoxylon sp. FL0890]|nr:Clavaminate synthase-like protein [Hypoxylon sp. FL0890]